VNYDLSPQDIDIISKALQLLPLGESYHTFEKVRYQHHMYLEQAQKEAQDAKQALEEKRATSSPEVKPARGANRGK
jgi:predicted DNA repair protein MutK